MRGVQGTVLAALLAGACTSEPPSCWSSPSPDTPRGVLEVGTGRDIFEPIAPEQVLPLNRGLQGCCHLWVNVRLTGMNVGVMENRGPGNPSTLFSAFLESGDAAGILECPDTVGYAPTADPNVADLMRGYALILQEDVLATLPGQRLRLEVEVFDPEGRYATDARWIVVGEFPP